MEHIILIFEESSYNFRCLARDHDILITFQMLPTSLNFRRGPMSGVFVPHPKIKIKKPKRNMFENWPKIIVELQKVSE